MFQKLPKRLLLHFNKEQCSSPVVVWSSNDCYWKSVKSTTKSVMLPSAFFWPGKNKSTTFLISSFLQLSFDSFFLFLHFSWFLLYIPEIQPTYLNFSCTLLWIPRGFLLWHSLTIIAFVSGYLSSFDLQPNRLSPFRLQYPRFARRSPYDGRLSWAVWHCNQSTSGEKNEVIFVKGSFPLRLKLYLRN